MPGDAERPAADADLVSAPGDDAGEADTAQVGPPAHSTRGRLVVLTGPSGVGKSTVLRALRSTHPQLWISVSVTTRQPRPGEVDGREYHFVTEQEFEYLLSADGLLEWASFAGNRYGTPRAPVLERLAAGTPVLLEIDLQGARQVRGSMPDAVQVFLAPPSWDELERRLIGRGTEPPDVIDRRLAAARVELNAEREFDISIDNHDVGLVCTQLLDLLGLQP